LTDVVDEMAEKIRDAVAAVTDLDVQVEPTLVLTPTTPCVDIFPAEPFRETDQAGFGDISGAYRFTVRARVSFADRDAGRDLLLQFMDDRHPLCIADALMDDQTLNGLVDNVEVTDPSGWRPYSTPDGAGSYVGCEWVCSVKQVIT
jgi:hypothetical protein